jgi:site-specific DNA-adenine methylase
MLLRNMGGKLKVAPKIIRYAPIEYDEYREPFCGAAGVFWRLPDDVLARLKRIWLNDANPDVIGFWIALKNDHDASLRRAIMRLKYRYANKSFAIQAAFERFRENYKANLHTWDEICFLIRYALGSMLNKYRRDGAALDMRYRGDAGPGVKTNLNYGYKRDGMAPITPDRLDYCYRRLQRVRLTCGDYSRLLTTPSKNSPWIFLDPTYILTPAIHHGKPVYGRELSIPDHEVLCKRLFACGHKWFMTINECPFTVDHYLTEGNGLNSWFLPMTYTGAPRMSNFSEQRKQHRKPPRVKELLIWNYDD